MLMRQLCRAGAVAVIVSALWFGVAWNAVERFAAPNGSGSACTAVSPCTVQTAVVASQPGDTVTLQNGTYTGASGMLNLGSYALGKDGNANGRITIRAQNDGAVRINGQGTHLPLRMSGNSFWTIEGINFSDSGGNVVAVDDASTDNILRRFVAWNANGTNVHVITVNDSSNRNLFEDFAGFGTGRNILIEAHQSATGNNTFRRGWVRWEGWPAGNGATCPGPAIQIAYGTAHTSLFENIITIHSAERYVGSQCTGGTIIGGTHFRDDSPTGNLPGYRLRGFIAYGYNNPKLKIDHAFGLNMQNAPVDIKDLYVDATATNSITNSTVGWPVLFGCKSTEPTCPTAKADRVTTIKNAAGAASVVNSTWTVTNRQECTSVASCPSLYNGANRANMCFRYQDGSLTTTPLWPWPMDARIKAAIATANGQALAGGAQTVTSEIESRYGAVPAACRSDFPIPPTDPPVVVAPSSVRAPVADRPPITEFTAAPERPGASRPIP